MNMPRFPIASAAFVRMIGVLIRNLKDPIYRNPPSHLLTTVRAPHSHLEPEAATHTFPRPIQHIVLQGIAVFDTQRHG